MSNPLILAWRVTLGAGIGTILGVFAGLSLFGTTSTDGNALLNCLALGTLAGGTITWVWERWKEREAIAASRPDPFIPRPVKEEEPDG